VCRRGSILGAQWTEDLNDAKHPKELVTDKVGGKLISTQLIGILEAKKVLVDGYADHSHAVAASKQSRNACPSSIVCPLSVPVV
jgi:hypothetical protein